MSLDFDAWGPFSSPRPLSQKLDPPRYIFQAQQFLLKWSFYGNLAIRDLTVKSAVSFGKQT